MDGGNISRLLNQPMENADALDDLRNTIDFVAAGGCYLDDTRWVYSPAVGNCSGHRADQNHSRSSTDLIPFKVSTD